MKTQVYHGAEDDSDHWQDRYHDPRSLKPGDYLFIPAYVRHRVTFTDPKRPRAVHIGTSLLDVESGPD